MSSRLLLTAQSGNGTMSALSPLSGVKRKLDLGAVRSAYDPQRTPRGQSAAIVSVDQRLCG